MTEMDPSANPYYNRPVAVIGDQWFAFGKEEDTLCVEATAYLANTPRIQIVQQIFNALNQMSPTNTEDPYVTELYAYCDAYLAANNIR